MARTSRLDHVWTVGPTTILDLRANLSRYEEPNNDQGRRLRSALARLPHQLHFAAGRVSAFPRITGLFGDIGAGQAGSVVDTSYYTFAGTLTKVTGNMTWKIGAEHWVLQQANKGIGNAGRLHLRQQQLDPPERADRRRHRQSVPTPRPSCLGCPTAAAFPRNADAFWSQHFEAFYVQNDWRVTPRLTINMGLR